MHYKLHVSRTFHASIPLEEILRLVRAPKGYRVSMVRAEGQELLVRCTQGTDETLEIEEEKHE